MVHEVYQIVTRSSELPPPMEETLSQAALDKFNDLNPLLQESFRLVWNSSRMRRVDPAVKLEKDLLKMPRELPGVTSLGLPSTVVEILQGEPDLWDFAQRIIAADLVLTQEWSRGDGAVLHQLMAQYGSPDGMEAFENRLIPSPNGPSLPMACMYVPEAGVLLPTGAVPVSFRDVGPASLMFRWPAPNETLSERAMTKFADFDTKMKDTLDFWWYGAEPLPVEAHRMACSITQWYMGISNMSFTSIPEPEEVLSSAALDLYEKFSERGQEAFVRQLGLVILKGDFVVQYDPIGYNTERYSSNESSSEKFLEGLSIWSDKWVRDRACTFEQLGCSKSPPLEAQPRGPAELQ